MDLTAFILAGGRSSRMGRDKTELSFRGCSLLSHAAEIARTLTDRVRIVGPRAKFGADAIEDLFPDRGPLGGIHAALRHSESEFNLVLAVDMPFLAAEFLRFLVSAAESSAATVTVPFVGGRFQPLCAVYRRDFADLAEPALRAGHNKIDALFAITAVRRIEEDEMIRLAFDPRMFDNLNTPEDVERAQQRA